MATANLNQESSVKTSPGAPLTRRLEGYPPSTRRFDWTMSILGVILVAGLYQDGWAHNHGRVDNTFFTPWHAILYGGIGVNGLVLAVNQYRHVLQGYTWPRALPRGYLLSLVGVALFFAGGAVDFLWHSVVGFEVNIEALLSPPHFMLAAAGVLIITGPLRSLVLNAKLGHKTRHQGWRALFPLIISLLNVLSLLTFFTQYSNVFSQGQLLTNRPGDDVFMWEVAALSFVTIPTFLTMSIVLFAVRRWRLPFGALTVLLGLNALLMWLVHFGEMQRYGPILIGPFLAGLVGDLLLRRGVPLKDHPLVYRVFASLVPAILMGVPLIYLRFTYGIFLTEHVWLGAIFTAGVIGLLLSYLALTPTLEDQTG